MPEAQKHSYIKFLPGVQFKIDPDFKQLDRNPSGWRRENSSSDYDEGLRVARLGLKVGKRPVGAIDVVEISLGTDKSAEPLVLPGGDTRPYALYVILEGLDALEANQVAIGLTFRGKLYNALTSAPDERQLELTGTTNISQYYWIENGRREEVNLGFSRSQIPEIDFLITGIRRPRLLATGGSAIHKRRYRS